ncbi:MAG TPA: carboxypeptidase-like regulatory domain-containing protein, partial [Candidatus Acidoferrales bacterium]|nr:carboxypeptidase-like regulatory domain-containing protein [Candidatus Acidoferrales bacterium]
MIRRLKYSVPILLALVTILALLPHASWAATTANVAGTLRDSDGRPVAGATVVLQGPVARKTTSDAHGAFRFDTVPA